MRLGGITLPQRAEKGEGKCQQTRDNVDKMQEGDHIKDRAGNVAFGAGKKDPVGSKVRPGADLDEAENDAERQSKDQPDRNHPGIVLFYCVIGKDQGKAAGNDHSGADKKEVGQLVNKPVAVAQHYHVIAEECAEKDRHARQAPVHKAFAAFFADKLFAADFHVFHYYFPIINAS